MRLVRFVLEWQFAGQPRERDVGLGAAEARERGFGGVGAAFHAEGGRQHAVGADKVSSLPERLTRQADRFRAIAAYILTTGRTRLSVPTGLLHSSARLRQLFEIAVDLRAVHAEILKLAIVELAQGLTRSVTLVARDHRCEEAVYETAQARKPNCSSPGKWPGGGGLNGGQHRHGYFLSTVAGTR
jgi:hypothetical protein